LETVGTTEVVDPQAAAFAGAQLPPVHIPVPLLQQVQSCAGSLTHTLPWHHLHVGQSATVPLAAGFPPQCHPAFNTPTPGSDAITDPSVLTVPVPIATNDAKS